MPNWNGVPLPEPPQIKIPNSLPRNFNWESYMSDPKGNFRKFTGAREVQRLNWRGYMTSSRQIKKVVANSPSKRIIQSAGRQIRKLKGLDKTVDKVKKTADGANKIVEFLKKGAFKKINPDWGARLGIYTSLASAGLTVWSIKVNEEVQAINLRTGEKVEADLQNAFTRSINNSIQIRGLQKQITETNKKLAEGIDKTYAEAASAAKNATTARKIANDSLYEMRANTSKFKQQVNDLTYEIRAGRQKLQSQIENIQTKVNQSLSSIGQGFQQQVNSTIANIQKGLQQAQTEARKANTQVESQSKLISNLQSTLNQIKVTAVNSTQIIDTAVIKIKDFFNPQIRELKNDISTIKVTFNKDIQQTNQNVNQLGVTVKSYSGVADTLQATYSQSFEAKANQFYQEQLKAQNNFLKEVKTTTVTTTSALDKNKQELEKLKTENGQIKTDLQDLQKQIKEQEKVNNAALPKLDSILSAIPLIPAKVADKINPNIPTPQDIEKATGTAMCKSLNGGCSGKALNDAVGNINNNANNNTNNVLNALGAASDVANLALLPIINNKLGDQLPGGIGGKLERFSKWLHLDRALNLMIWATTIHNALMLSNDIGQTLLGAISNVFQLFGLKDSEGNAFDLSSIISSSIENIIKSIIGADNYVELKEAWQKANRIYQATINIFNQTQGLLSTILNALEITAGRVGKIGNALKKVGEVADSAYAWMNPQPKFNRVTQFLENLQNGASTIQMVTQAPLDIINSVTELTNAGTELTNALKEDNKPENKGTEDKEPDQLKAVQAASKIASLGQEMIDPDLEPDED